MRFTLTFYGRVKGAIGINYTITTVVEADDCEDAKLKLYDTHEPYFGVHRITCREIPAP